MATTFDNSLESQSDAISLRRQVIDGIDGTNDSGDAESSALRPSDLWGLALSGGGIRSATYSLGFVWFRTAASLRLSQPGRWLADPQVMLSIRHR